MKTIKVLPIVSLLLLTLAAGCAHNRTTDNRSSEYNKTPVEQPLKPTSDRPDAEPHIYSNSTSRATSPAPNENQ